MEVCPIAALAIPTNKRLCRMQQRHRPLAHPLTSDGGTVPRKCDPKQAAASIDIGSNVSRKEGIDFENEKGNIRDGREFGQCLMEKVLTARKLQLNQQLNQQANKHVGQICTLENIITSGEVKRCSLGSRNQLARLIDDQETRIMNEVELKKEFNGVRI